MTRSRRADGSNGLLRSCRTHFGEVRRGGCAEPRGRLYLELDLGGVSGWRHGARFTVTPHGRRRFVIRRTATAAGEGKTDALGRRVYQVSRRFRGTRELAVVERISRLFTPNAVVLVHVYRDRIEVVETETILERHGRRFRLRLEPARVAVLHGFDDEAHAERVAEALRKRLAERRRYTVSDYFAGCGGTHLGFWAAGFRTLYAVDWNRWAAQLYRLNFPEVPYYICDIRSFVPTGPVPTGLITTFPCDDFSLLGSVSGLDGAQSGLFREVLRQIDLLAPREFVFIENVAHLMRARGGRDREVIREELARRGFPHYHDAVMDGLGYVPQKRSRYIAVAFREKAPFSFPESRSERVFLGSIMEPDEQVPTSYNWSERMARYFTERRGRHSSPIIGRPDSLYANTLTENGYKGNQGSPIYQRPDGTLRKFTEREMARYMGFPEWYKMDGLSWSRVVQIMGNSVIPPLIAAVARQIRSALEVLELRRVLPLHLQRPVVQLAFA